MSGLLFPAEIRADIRAAPSASLAGKPQIEIGKPDSSGHRSPMTVVM
jgi:hypothetical protein